ncbi:MAG: 7-cyano-7-deazaguanine synthase QueC [Planctomycetota bacterium]
MNRAPESKTDAALVVLSGGQDSTTALFWASHRYARVSALTFAYGQKHGREIDCARRIAALAGVPHRVMELDLFRAAGVSTLVNGGQPRPHPGLPDTFVPGRNLVFLTHAAVIAYREGAHTIVAGMSQVDYSGYPDCRREAIDALAQALALGMDFPVRIVTPLIDLSKAAIVKLAVAEGCLAMLAHTHTCYTGAYPPCGSCAACRLRAKGFGEAGIPDPLLAADGAP